MTRKKGGIGRHPGKTSHTAKTEGLRTDGTVVHDESAARSDAAALLNLSNISPAPETGLRRFSPATLKAAASKYNRAKVEQLEGECDRLSNLKNEANARARAAEEREDRAKVLAAKRLKERDAARESERAWREESHQFEDEMEGLASEPIVADLPAIGKESRADGGGRGRERWPMWMVQLIIEKLALSASRQPPSLTTSCCRTG